jgi:anaphase-promoting complex subunit 3
MWDGIDMRLVDKHSDTSRRHVPDAAAGFCLLGKLYSGHGDTKKALGLYVESLQLNPFMWDAFTALCDIRAVVRPAAVFKITPEILATMTQPAPNGHGPTSSNPQDPFETKQPFVSTPDVDPFNPSRPGADSSVNLGSSNLLSKLNGSIQAVFQPGAGVSDPFAETPTSNSHNMADDDVMMGDVGGPVINDHSDITHAPSRKPRMAPVSAHDEPPRMRQITTSRTRIKTTSEATERTEIPQPVGHWQNGHKRTVSGHSTQHAQYAQPTSTQPADVSAAAPRRSARLFNSIRPSSSRLASAPGREEAKERRELRKAKATGTKGKPGSTSTVGRVVSGNRKPMEFSDALKPESRPASVASVSVPPPPPKMAIAVDRPREPEVLNWILELLRRVGSGYLHLSRFECVEALKAFQSIPDQQRETPWVLAQIGKAHYERSKYAEAEKMFQRIRELAPSYTEDMEVYSNTLWQLKKETELAYLAHTLVDQDRLSPQAWCALGNAFSLQREHDQAIKCFTRATQLDSKFAYAFTLQGHEHVQNEEYDKATLAYRCAVSADNRHYNGWYGLGCVYEKLGKHEVAEQHYRAAFQINPTNPLLAVRIGSVSHPSYSRHRPQLTLFRFSSA